MQALKKEDLLKGAWLDKGRYWEVTAANETQNNVSDQGETTQKRTQKTTQKKTQKQQEILDFLKEHPEASRKDIAAGITGMTENGVKSIIRTLKQKGLLKHSGPDRGGNWEVIDENYNLK